MWKAEYTPNIKIANEWFVTRSVTIDIVTTTYLY